MKQVEERYISLLTDFGFYRLIYECLSASFPSFYLVVSGKKRNFAVKLDVELNEWRMKQVEERYIAKKFGMQALSVQANMNDIFRWSTVKAERGIDYPFARTVSFSIGATF